VSQHKIKKIILIKIMTTSATMETLAAASHYQENCVDGEQQ
jgi:hypothetical protein